MPVAGGQLRLNQLRIADFGLRIIPTAFGPTSRAPESVLPIRNPQSAIRN